MKRLFVVLAVVAMMACAVSAMAALNPVGAPFEVGSWAQGFNESGVGNFDHLQFGWISGGQFEFVNAFSDGSWMQSYNDGLLLTANGNVSTNLTFTLGFTGAQSAPLAFNFSAWDGTTLRENVNASWNGGGWSFSNGDPNVEFQNPVPEPMSVILGIMGLSSIAGFRKLRRK